MPTRTLVALTVVLAASVACRTARRSPAPEDDRGSGSTSVYGHWVLATPAESTGFAGASKVELVLAPGTFTVSVGYPDRTPLTLRGRAELGDDGLLTLVAADGAADSTVGLPAGQPFTRVASASGATLVLAPPGSRVPIPSSVWYRFDAAHTAGLVP